MDLVIVAPNGILTNTKTDQVSMPGEIGRFSVLPGHASLIAHLTAGEITYADHGKQVAVAIKSGFVRVHKDQVEVCVETEEAKKPTQGK
ncbi:F0F1 ATP synthase subunit epsilon [uncultured Alistipes sp.]|jgi:ATP synthase F1, epsilon subunit|uniref:FoF1 ATP synthase subunit delta/epsilon n=1 Tax=uncultured Alistipes sp. TaxID=538949 RepID=UPI0025F5415A|nr:F0F1 ATP synthase subunit epsilon [uncultured Alistipes sp.]